jgi:hypothetical protein
MFTSSFTRSLTSRAANKLDVLENRILRKIFWCRREEYDSEERSSVICTPHQVLRYGQAFGSYGEKRNAWRILVWKPGGKRRRGMWRTTLEGSVLVISLRKGKEAVLCDTTVNFGVA